MRRRCQPAEKVQHTTDRDPGMPHAGACRIQRQSGYGQLPSGAVVADSSVMVRHWVVHETSYPPLGLISKHLRAGNLTEVVVDAAMRDDDRLLAIDGHPAHGVDHLGNYVRHSVLLCVTRSGRVTRQSGWGIDWTAGGRRDRSRNRERQLKPMVVFREPVFVRLPDATSMTSPPEPQLSAD